MDDMEKRLGFHYFQDYDHYQARDLELWIPELASLQASWLVLKAPTAAAIPEEFITGLIQAGIQPFLHFDFQVNNEVRPEDLRVILSSYANWGVKYVIFFDRPNAKSAWTDGVGHRATLWSVFLTAFCLLCAWLNKTVLFLCFLLWHLEVIIGISHSLGRSSNWFNNGAPLTLV
jgi:hypothetical protein